MASSTLARLVLQHLTLVLGMGLLCSCEEYVTKPNMEISADVMFLAAYAEHSDVAVFVDGKRQQFATSEGGLFSADETNSIRVDVRSSHLVAVVVTPYKKSPEDGEGPSPLGMIVSLEQHTRTQEFATSDASWKCRYGTPAMRRLKDKKTGRKWYSPDYDDSHWPAAKILGNHGDKPWGPLMDISSAAKWIWADTDNRKQTALCRGWLSHNPDVLYMTADSQFTVFADGREVGTGLDWERTHRFPVPGRKFHQVAVHAWQDVSQDTTERLPGILASIQTPHPPSGVSNNLWKCRRRIRDEDQDTWMLESFDDSRWLPAKEVEAHNGEESFKGVRLDISQHASWIWAAGQRKEGQRQEAYCRAKMSSTMHALKVKTKSETSATSSTSDKTANDALDMKYFHPRSHYEKIVEVDVGQLDYTTYFRDFLSKGRPFVIRGGVASWPAYEKWTDEYLLQKIGADQATITFAPENVFYFYGEKQDMRDGTVRDFLTKYRQPGRKENLYLAQHPLQSSGTSSAVRSDVKQPPFSKFLFLEDAFMWMGAGDQVTPLHFDNSENIMCMVTGKKVVKVYEPSMSNYLYPAIQNKNTAVTSRIKNLSRVDTEQFPEFGRASSLTVTLEAGDMFYLPAYWWHEVTSYGRNIAVNWWFNTHSTTLDAVYNSWTERLPQTQWGLARQQQYDEEMRRQQDEAEEKERPQRGSRIRHEL